MRILVPGGAASPPQPHGGVQRMLLLPAPRLQVLQEGRGCCDPCLVSPAGHSAAKTCYACLSRIYSLTLEGLADVFSWKCWR
eukprot:9399817-Pyramimonas_sp.AAC.1